jgi:hypothetical protein
MCRSEARPRAQPPLQPLWGRAHGPANEPSGPLRRAQGRGPHRSHRQPTPLPGLRCGARLAHCASSPRRPIPVVRSEGGWGAAHRSACAFWAAITTHCRSSRSCTPFATTRLRMRYRLVASSVPSSASWSRGCSNPGPGSPYCRLAERSEGQRLHPAQPPSSLSYRCHGPGAAGAALPFPASKRGLEEGATALLLSNQTHAVLFLRAHTHTHELTS